jgi:uncharacterized phage-like protein YoqJ
MTLGITGHRDFDPKKFNYERFLEFLIKEKVSTIIVGGAPGFDNFIGELAVKLDIPLEVYLPYKGFCKNKKIIEHSIFTGWIHEKYKDKSAFFQRNRLIATHSDMLACYYDGRKSGGTYYTQSFAKEEMHVPVINFYNG